MELKLKIGPRFTEATHSGKTKKYRNTFLNKLSYKDAVRFLTDPNTKGL